MSYCRNNGTDSDVYLIRAFNKVLECVGCYLSPDRSSFTTDSEWSMLLHLDEHAEAGHKVPERARIRLREEMDA